MASLRSTWKCAEFAAQQLWRPQTVLNLARDPKLRGITAMKAGTMQLFFTLSISSVSEGGSKTGGERADKDASEDLMFIDSSQEDVLAGTWLDPDRKADSKDGQWKNQLTWLTSMVDPSVNSSKEILPPGDLAEKWDGSGTSRSMIDIVTGLLKSTAGMQQWGLADITLGLYLLSVRHADEMAFDTVQGQKMTSDFMIQEWIYHLELAWGAYMKDKAMLSRVSMLQEENVVKFVNSASIMRPAYYVGVDPRNELVILSIRGTQSVHDLITDLLSESEHAEKVDGEPAHYGSVEAARWFIRFEADTLRKCLEENKGFRLLITGHSLGGATASLLGLMLRKDPQRLLGLPADRIKVVGIATPPCVSKVLASRCRDFISTLVLQDDAIPRMSSPALIRLRNEILGADWNDVLKDGVERKGLPDFVVNTIQALTSVQDAARKYGAIARSKINMDEEDEQITATNASKGSDLEKQKQELMQTMTPPKELPELVAPGALFHLCSREIQTPEYSRNLDGSKCSLWKGEVDSYLERIVVSPTMVSDHRCESYYYGLRDVLKGLPISKKFTLF